MSNTSSKITIDTYRSDLYVYNAFRKMEKKYNQENVDYIMIKITTSKKEEDAYFMLWEVINSNMYDFLSVLKATIHLDDWDEYEITTTTNVVLHNQENFYCALLLYLLAYFEADEETDTSMEIAIRQKLSDTK